MALLDQAAKNLTDIIFCNFEKIQDQLVNYLSKSLENMIGQVLDVPICGIENFLGDMFGQINNILDSNLGTMFSQLNNIQGGGIALPSKTFSKAIQFSNILTNVLDCDRIKCPKPTKFSTKGGVSNIIPDDFGNIISNGIEYLTNLADGIDNIADGIPHYLVLQTVTRAFLNVARQELILLEVVVKVQVEVQ